MCIVFSPVGSCWEVGSDAQSWAKLFRSYTANKGSCVGVGKLLSALSCELLNCCFLLGSYWYFKGRFEPDLSARNNHQDHLNGWIITNPLYQRVIQSVVACILFLVDLCKTRTGFYALCLISKTPDGSDALLGHGWTSVRHAREEKWPVILEEAVEEVMTPVHPPISPSATLSTLPSSLTSHVDGEEPSTDASSSDSANPPKKIKQSTLGLSSSMDHRRSNSKGLMNMARVIRRRSSLQVRGHQSVVKTQSYIKRSLRPLSFVGDNGPSNTTWDCLYIKLWLLLVLLVPFYSL